MVQLRTSVLPRCHRVPAVWCVVEHKQEVEGVSSDSESRRPPGSRNKNRFPFECRKETARKKKANSFAFGLVTVAAGEQHVPRAPAGKRGGGEVGVGDAAHVDVAVCHSPNHRSSFRFRAKGVRVLRCENQTFQFLGGLRGSTPSRVRPTRCDSKCAGWRDGGAADGGSVVGLVTERGGGPLASVPQSHGVDFGRHINKCRIEKE
jgi:hypothetical protein